MDPNQGGVDWSFLDPGGFVFNTSADAGKNYSQTLSQIAQQAFQQAQGQRGYMEGALGQSEQYFNPAVDQYNALFGGSGGYMDYAPNPGFPPPTPYGVPASGGGGPPGGGGYTSSAPNYWGYGGAPTKGSITGYNGPPTSTSSTGGYGGAPTGANITGGGSGGSSIGQVQSPLTIGGGQQYRGTAVTPGSMPRRGTGAPGGGWQPTAGGGGEGPMGGPPGGGGPTASHTGQGSLTQPGVFEKFAAGALSGNDPYYKMLGDQGRASIDQEMNAGGNYGAGARMAALGKFQSGLDAQQYHEMAGMQQAAQQAAQDRQMLGYNAAMGLGGARSGLSSNMYGGANNAYASMIGAGLGMQANAANALAQGTISGNAQNKNMLGSLGAAALA